MILLFVVTAAAVQAFFPLNGTPRSGAPSVDLLDDLAAVYRWLKEQVKFAGPLFSAAERVLSIGWLQKFIDWLNPRKRP